MGKNGGEAFQHPWAQACHNEDLLDPASQVIIRSNQNNEFQQVFLLFSKHIPLQSTTQQGSGDMGSVFASPDFA